MTTSLDWAMEGREEKRGESQEFRKQRDQKAKWDKRVKGSKWLDYIGKSHRGRAAPSLRWRSLR